MLMTTILMTKSMIAYHRIPIPLITQFRNERKNNEETILLNNANEKTLNSNLKSINCFFFSFSRSYLTKIVHIQWVDEESSRQIEFLKLINIRWARKKINRFVGPVYGNTLKQLIWNDEVIFWIIHSLNIIIMWMCVFSIFVFFV